MEEQEEEEPESENEDTFISESDDCYCEITKCRLTLVINRQRNIDNERAAKIIRYYSEKHAYESLCYYLNYEEFDDCILLAIVDMVMRCKEELLTFCLKGRHPFSRGGWNNVSIKTWRKFGEAVKQCPRLQMMSLSGGLTDKPNFKTFLRVLSPQQNLQVIDFEYGVSSSINEMTRDYLSGEMAKTLQNMFTLLSVRAFPRIGGLSPLMRLKKDIIQMLAEYVGI